MICNVFRNPKLHYRFKYLISVILPNEEAKHCTKSFTPVQWGFIWIIVRQRGMKEVQKFNVKIELLLGHAIQTHTPMQKFNGVCEVLDPRKRIMSYIIFNSPMNMIVIFVLISLRAIFTYITFAVWLTLLSRIYVLV